MTNTPVGPVTAIFLAVADFLAAPVKITVQALRVAQARSDLAGELAAVQRDFGKQLRDLMLAREVAERAGDRREHARLGEAIDDLTASWNAHEKDARAYYSHKCGVRLD